MPVAFHRTTVSRAILAAAVVAATVSLTACKKDSTAPKQLQVAANTTLAANPTVVTAIAATPFSFPGQAGVLSSSLAGKDMVVTFAGTATAPTATFALSGAGGTGTVTANVTFGSCVFLVAAVTGNVGSMQVGQTITVNPCNINVNTAGQQANGVAQSRAIALVLGAASSANATVTVGVNAGGQLTLNGGLVGTVTLVPISG